MYKHGHANLKNRAIVSDSPFAGGAGWGGVGSGACLSIRHPSPLPSSNFTKLRQRRTAGRQLASSGGKPLFATFTPISNIDAIL